MNHDWLKSTLIKSSAMFAIVTDKSFKDRKFIDVLIDISKSEFLKSPEDETYCYMHCYLVESLATTVREYKTLRMSEFYSFSKLILNPK